MIQKLIKMHGSVCSEKNIIFILTIYQELNNQINKIYLKIVNLPQFPQIQITDYIKF